LFVCLSVSLFVVVVVVFLVVAVCFFVVFIVLMPRNWLFRPGHILGSK
jgi:hypothetical protein